jgi:hypothetical protein
MDNQRLSRIYRNMLGLNDVPAAPMFVDMERELSGAGEDEIDNFFKRRFGTKRPTYESDVQKETGMNPDMLFDIALMFADESKLDPFLNERGKRFRLKYGIDQ